MKAKLEEKGYEVEYIKVQIENTEEYKIKQVNIFIKESKKEEKEQETKTENKIEVKVNKIEEVNIQLKNNEAEETIEELDINMDQPLIAEEIPYNDQPYSINIKIPPMAAIVLKVNNISDGSKECR